MTASVQPNHGSRSWPEAGIAPGACPPPSDLASVLLELCMNSRGARQDAARADVEEASRLLEEARRQIRAALERAENANGQAGFWGSVSQAFGGDLAAIAGVVGAVALAVATGGAGTAAVLAVVAAGLTAGAKAGEALGLDPRITAALGAAGAAVGLVAGDGVNAAKTWVTIGQVANATQGAASTAGGGAAVAQGHYESQAAHARADARASESAQADAWLRFDLALAALDQACRDVSRAQEGAANVQQTENDGSYAVLARMGTAS